MVTAQKRIWTHIVCSEPISPLGSQRYSKRTTLCLDAIHTYPLYCMYYFLSTINPRSIFIFVIHIITLCCPFLDKKNEFAIHLVKGLGVVVINIGTRDGFTVFLITAEANTEWSIRQSVVVVTFKTPWVETEHNNDSNISVMLVCTPCRGDDTMLFLPVGDNGPAGRGRYYNNDDGHIE